MGRGRGRGGRGRPTRSRGDNEEGAEGEGPAAESNGMSDTYISAQRYVRVQYIYQLDLHFYGAAIFLKSKRIRTLSVFFSISNM